MDPIDVALITLNSERKLRDCLDSVYANVPVNRLLIVDGFSKDGTLSILEEYRAKYGKVVIVQEKGTRGSARQTAIGMVETEWFMFVDSDVVLSKGWFAKAEKLIKPDVGAVWGIEVWSVLAKSKILPIFERVTLKIFYERGGTHDLLVRKKAVEGIHIPFELHTYEDGYIKKWIEKNNYKVLGVYDPYCMHYRPEGIWTVETHIGFAVSDLKYAIKRPMLL
ncbi:MAG TPA: glycosyltransferase family A protein, partial [Candidatus Acidoferrales bacterium]|nr:glycosyltransferase family A protein [Candidatus Acidoferrales bacterium]